MYGCESWKVSITVRQEYQLHNFEVYSCKINEGWQQTYCWHSSVDIWYKVQCENMQPALNWSRSKGVWGIQMLSTSTSLFLIRCSVWVFHRSLPLRTLSSLKWSLPWWLWRPHLHRGPRILLLHKATRRLLLIGSVSKRWSCSGQCRDPSEWEQWGAFSTCGWGSTSVAC